jgi:hypothetical protein
MTVGLLGMAGSVTGNLAGMIAAIFDPSDLGPPGGSKSGSSIASGIGGLVETGGLGLLESGVL